MGVIWCIHPPPDHWDRVDQQGQFHVSCPLQIIHYSIQFTPIVPIWIIGLRFEKGGGHQDIPSWYRRYKNELCHCVVKCQCLLLGGRFYFVSLSDLEYVFCCWGGGRRLDIFSEIIKYLSYVLDHWHIDWSFFFGSYPYLLPSNHVPYPFRPTYSLHILTPGMRQT